MAYELLLTAQDFYADPYRLALRELGSSKAVLFFPLIGHFALQAPQPVVVYAAAVDRLKVGPEPEAGFVIHDYWRTFLELAEVVCAEACAQFCDGATLQPTWDVINETALGTNPIYRHYLALIDLFLASERSWDGLAFALPGDPDVRVELGQSFLPPVVVFNDGHWAESTALSTLGRYLKAKGGDDPVARAPGLPPVALDGLLDPEPLANHSTASLAMERRRDKARVLSDLHARRRP
jgi:hypothetical protein